MNNFTNFVLMDIDIEFVKKQIIEFLLVPHLKDYWRTTGVTPYMYDLFIQKYDYTNGIFYKEFWSDDDSYDISDESDYHDGYCWRVMKFTARDMTLFSSVYDKLFNSKNIIQETNDTISRIEKKLCVGSYIKMCDPRMYENEIKRLGLLKEESKLYESIS